MRSRTSPFRNSLACFSVGLPRSACAVVSTVNVFTIKTGKPSENNSTKSKAVEKNELGYLRTRHMPCHSREILRNFANSWNPPPQKKKHPKKTVGKPKLVGKSSNNYSNYVDNREELFLRGFSRGISLNKQRSRLDYKPNLMRHSTFNKGSTQSKQTQFKVNKQD